MRDFLIVALLAVIVASTAPSRADAGMTSGNDDATEIVRLLLEDARLRQYLPEPSSASPLKLANRTQSPVSPEALGLDAEVITPKSPELSEALIVEAIDRGDNRATLRFRYPPEGLRGTAVFKFDRQLSRWHLVSIEIFET